MRQSQQQITWYDPTSRPQLPLSDGAMPRYLLSVDTEDDGNVTIEGFPQFWEADGEWEWVWESHEGPVDPGDVIAWAFWPQFGGWE